MVLGTGDLNEIGQGLLLLGTHTPLSHCFLMPVLLSRNMNDSCSYCPKACVDFDFSLNKRNIAQPLDHGIKDLQVWGISCLFV